jgi:hypothetical protein
MTPAASACWARHTFSVKLHPFRLISAILPRSEGAEREDGEEEEKKESW